MIIIIKKHSKTFKINTDKPRITDRTRQTAATVHHLPQSSPIPAKPQQPHTALQTSYSTHTHTITGYGQATSLAVIAKQLFPPPIITATTINSPMKPQTRHGSTLKKDQHIKRKGRLKNNSTRAVRYLLF